MFCYGSDFFSFREFLQRKHWNTNRFVRRTPNCHFEFTLEYFNWRKILVERSVTKENSCGYQIVSENIIWRFNEKKFSLDHWPIHFSGLSGQDVLSVLYFLPWLAALIPGKASGTEKMKLAVGTLHSVLKNSIEEHRQRFVPGTEPRDYIDAYLQQVEECDDPNSSFYKEEGGKICSWNERVRFDKKLSPSIFSSKSYRWSHKLLCPWHRLD